MLGKYRVRFVSLKPSKTKDGRDVTYGEGLVDKLVLANGEVMQELISVTIPGHGATELGIYDVAADVSIQTFKERSSLKIVVQNLKFISAAPAPQK